MTHICHQHGNCGETYIDCEGCIREQESEYQDDGASLGYMIINILGAAMILVGSVWLYVVFK